MLNQGAKEVKQCDIESAMSALDTFDKDFVQHPRNYKDTFSIEEAMERMKKVPEKLLHSVVEACASSDKTNFNLEEENEMDSSLQCRTNTVAKGTFHMELRERQKKPSNESKMTTTAAAVRAPGETPHSRAKNATYEFQGADFSYVNPKVKLRHYPRKGDSRDRVVSMREQPFGDGKLTDADSRAYITTQGDVSLSPEEGALCTRINETIERVFVHGLRERGPKFLEYEMREIVMPFKLMLGKALGAEEFTVCDISRKNPEFDQKKKAGGPVPKVPKLAVGVGQILVAGNGDIVERQVLAGVDVVTNATEMKVQLKGGPQLAQCGYEMLAINGLQCVPPEYDIDHIATSSALLCSGTLSTGLAAIGLQGVGYIGEPFTWRGNPQFVFYTEIAGDQHEDGVFHLFARQIKRSIAVGKAYSPREPAPPRPDIQPDESGGNSADGASQSGADNSGDGSNSGEGGAPPPSGSTDENFTGSKTAPSPKDSESCPEDSESFAQECAYYLGTVVPDIDNTVESSDEADSQVDGTEDGSTRSAPLGYAHRPYFRVRARIQMESSNVLHWGRNIPNMAPAPCP